MVMVSPALYWLILGVILFVLELSLPGFVLFFFAVGALLTALITWLTPISLAWQLAIFVTVSLVALLSLRDLIKKSLLAKKQAGDGIDEDATHAVSGDRAVVSVKIMPPASGRIRYAGTSWTATADEVIVAGETVAVVHQDDLVIHVEKYSS